jgi:ATP-dependent DNA helicase RecQ
MADVPKRRIVDLIDHLSKEGYLLTSDGQYPTITLSAKSGEITKGGTQIILKMPKYVEPLPPPLPTAPPPLRSAASPSPLRSPSSASQPSPPTPTANDESMLPPSRPSITNGTYMAPSTRPHGADYEPIKSNEPAAPVSAELFDALRVIRRRLADEAKVLAYVIFADAALKDMCRKMPSTESEFLDVSGVGEHKLAKYGAVFLETIRAYAAAQNDVL